MKIPTVEYCCCGLSLKLGTLLIGMIAFVGSIGAFTNTLDNFYDVDVIINHPDVDNPHIVKVREHLFALNVLTTEVIFLSLLIIINRRKFLIPFICNCFICLAVKMYLFMGFLLTVTGTILSAVLLMGYFTSNRSMLRAWVIGNISIHVLSLLGNVGLSILLDEYLYMVYCLVVFLNLYFACVVNSYAQDIFKGSSSSIA